MGAKIFPGQRLDTVIASIPIQELWHMQRVGELTNELLRLMVQYASYQNHVDKLSRFNHYGFFHDIGKAWIPVEILKKSDLLTPEEYKKVKMHPVYAKEYFEKNPDVIDIEPSIRSLLFDAAVYHHERWDGGGYPYNLSGDNIPLIARVVAVCDAYDAITTKRPYREAKPHKEACREIKTNAGTQFDPDIAAIFLENEKGFRVVHRRQSLRMMNEEVGIKELFDSGCYL